MIRPHRVGVMNIRVLAGDAWGTAVERRPKRMTQWPA